MGDLILMFWLGFFCGFWACVLVHVWYSILGPRLRRWWEYKKAERFIKKWGASWEHFRQN